MQLTTKKPITFLILYALTTSFYINRVLSRFIFVNANQLSWIFISLIALCVLFLMPILYKIMNVEYKNTKIVKVVLYVFLVISMLLAMLFVSILLNASWLSKTSYTFIIVPFLAILYYVFNHKNVVFLRLTTLFSIPIIIQYLIFIFAKNKSMDLYALIPINTSIQNPLFIILIGIQMILTFFLGAFYFGESKQQISKKQYYLSTLFILFTMIFDSIVVCGQFGKAIGDFPFVYYESWCLISFGQYIGYLDILAFYYFVSSAFCFCGLGFYLIQRDYSKKLYQLTYPLLYISLIFILTQAQWYQYIKTALLIISTFALLTCVLKVVINYVKQVD